MYKVKEKLTNSEIHALLHCLQEFRELKLPHAYEGSRADRLRQYVFRVHAYKVHAKLLARGQSMLLNRKTTGSVSLAIEELVAISILLAGVTLGPGEDSMGIIALGALSKFDQKIN